MIDSSARDRHGHRRIGTEILSLPSLSNRHVFPIKPESFTSYVREKKRRRNSRVARPKIFFFFFFGPELKSSIVTVLEQRPPPPPFPLGIRSTTRRFSVLNIAYSWENIDRFFVQLKIYIELYINRSSRYLDSFPINKFRFPVIAVSTVSIY